MDKLKAGVRVVRGPNWTWGNEDGGEGYAGVLREINTKDKIAVVQWDNGSQMQCRIGCLDKFDLRVIDNAQIGVTHMYVICDECNTGNIFGIRYQCMVCHNYDLCSMCYHGDKHNLSHSFRRIETSRSRGVNLPPRVSFRKCELKGIFKGAEVIRGADWEWKNQDGGAGKLGIVVDIKGWKNKSVRSTVYVQWLQGNTELYRLGHKGLCDVQFVEAATGGYYYPEHLPVLGLTEEQMEWDQILNFIEIQQVQELETEMKQSIQTEDTDIWENEKHSTLVQLGSIESMYASKIMQFNDSVKKGVEKPNLIEEFSKMVSEFRNDEVKEMWEMVKYMTCLPEISSPRDVIETRYTKKYIEAMVQNGKKYLEESFKNYMTIEVNKQLQVNISSIYQLVHAFVGLRFQGEYTGLQDEIIDNRPLWPMTYYLIRVGDFGSAASCLSSSPLLFHEIISLLRAKISSPNDKLTETELGILEEKVRFSYTSTVRDENDPFKRTVFALLGLCNELTEIIKTADDYLWFSLSMIQHDVFNQYSNLQYMISEKQGESHYDAFNKPALYFKLLTLTGQFEAAIDFLFRTDSFKADAVHMAVALNEKNLLAVSRITTLPLLSQGLMNTKSAQDLNLALLIKSYVSKLEERSLNGALHYFFLLRNCDVMEPKNLFDTFVSDLAIGTKQYVKLFGKVQSDGTRSMGLVDQFTDAEAQMKSVGKTLYKKKLYEEAIALFEATNHTDGILRIMCRLLPKVAQFENEPGSLRDKIREKAAELEKRLSKEDYKNIEPNLITSFFKLKGILTFFDLYRAKHYSEALQELIILDIIPLKCVDINEKVENIGVLTEDLNVILPHILLATMTILCTQCNSFKKTRHLFMESYSEDHLRGMWEQANCVINFAQRLPEAIVGDITDKLLQMGASMH